MSFNQKSSQIIALPTGYVFDLRLVSAGMREPWQCEKISNPLAIAHWGKKKNCITSHTVTRRCSNRHVMFSPTNKWKCLSYWHVIRELLLRQVKQWVIKFEGNFDAMKHWSQCDRMSWWLQSMRWHKRGNYKNQNLILPRNDSLLATNQATNKLNYSASRVTKRLTISRNNRIAWKWIVVVNLSDDFTGISRECSFIHVRLMWTFEGHKKFKGFIWLL